MNTRIAQKVRNRELQYLVEDLVKDLSKLPDEIYVGPFEQELIDEVNKKIELLSSIQLGQAKVLDSIQYVTGEMGVRTTQGLQQFHKA